MAENHAQTIAMNQKLQQEFNQLEHSNWLLLTQTQRVLHQLQQLRLKKLEIAAGMSQNTAISELELRKNLNVAATIKEVIDFIQKPS